MSSKRSSSLSTIALLFFAMFSLSGCYTAKKALEKGDYNTAIRKAEKRLNGKKQKDKHILVLETAYEKALYRDLNRIDQLQKEDMIANWKTVLSLYKVLDARQDKLERYLPLYVATEYRDAEFEKHDFKTEINSLKDNAAEYLYRSAQFLKDSKDKEDIREANGLLTDLNKLKPGYKDVSALMRQTLAAGKNYILIQGVSARNLPLPRELSASLLSVQTGKLNQKWLEFHNKPVKSVQYDYTIELNMYQMFVSPGIISENTYTDSRKIEDGWAYELDEKGNVKKDSLGNDIKTTQYKRILCDVVETKLAKNARYQDLKQNRTNIAQSAY